jgi:hypothetical protein
MCARVLSRVREGANKRAGQSGQNPAAAIRLRNAEDRTQLSVIPRHFTGHRCVKAAVALTPKQSEWRPREHRRWVSSSVDAVIIRELPLHFLGVIGLSTALVLSEHNNLSITVLAKHMPRDYDIEYASP